MSGKSDGKKLEIVGIVTIIDRGALYLRRRRGTSTGGCINIPGGKIDPGETPEQAAVREFREETGTTISGSELENVGEFDSYAIARDESKRDIWVHAFLLVKSDISLDHVVLAPGEHEGKRVFTLKELKKFRGTESTEYIKTNNWDPERIVFTPPDAKLLNDYFDVFERGFAERQKLR